MRGLVVVIQLAFFLFRTSATYLIIRQVNRIAMHGHAQGVLAERSAWLFPVGISISRRGLKVSGKEDTTRPQFLHGAGLPAAS